MKSEPSEPSDAERRWIPDLQFANLKLTTPCKSFLALGRIVRNHNLSQQSRDIIGRVGEEQMKRHNRLGNMNFWWYMLLSTPVATV
jgi:hypothetical protein